MNSHKPGHVHCTYAAIESLFTSLHIMYNVQRYAVYILTTSSTSATMSSPESSGCSLARITDLSLEKLSSIGLKLGL